MSEDNELGRNHLYCFFGFFFYSLFLFVFLVDNDLADCCLCELMFLFEHTLNSGDVNICKLSFLGCFCSSEKCIHEILKAAVTGFFSYENNENVSQFGPKLLLLY